MMKLYLYIILLVAVDMLLVGSVLPMLFSASSYEAVIAGFFILVVAPIVNFLGIIKIIKLTKQFFKKPETTNETSK